MPPNATFCDDPHCDIDHHSYDATRRKQLLQISLPTPSDNKFHSSIDQVVFVKDPSGLHQIHNNNVQLAVWRRPQLPEFCRVLSEIQGIDDDDSTILLPSFEGVVTPDCCEQILRQYLCCKYNLRSKRHNALNDQCMDELVGDITRLVETFSEISDSELVNVKLEVLGDDGCQYWHQDSVPLRLVTTYRGPCTEFVPPQFGQETLKQRQDDSVHATSLFHSDVALFQGQGETDEESPLLGRQGIVHRSPRIMEDGILRLVLVLDIPQEGWHY